MESVPPDECGLREQALHENQTFTASVLDSLAQSIAVLDRHGVIISVNRSWRDFALNNGASDDIIRAVGINYLDTCRASLANTSEPDALAALSGIHEVLAGTTEEFSLEYACHSPTEQRWFIMHTTALRGEFPGAVIAHENITLRKLAEMQLFRSTQITQQFLDHLPGLAYVKDEQLRVVMANQAFQPLLGIDPATIVGKTNTEVFPGDFGRKIDADDRRILSSEQSVLIEEEFAGRFFESSKFVINGKNGQRLLGGITLDVTQRKKLFERQEAQLRISELGSALPEKEFLKAGLETIERLTMSQIGFLHFINDDQASIELVTWTSGALKGCNAGYASHYPMESAGIWADCARTGQTTVCNDYPRATAPKGLPEGHAVLQRFISVPIIEEDKVRMILGVGNKDSDYDENDCITARIIGNDLWRIAGRARAESALKLKLDELVLLNSRLDETNNKLLHSEKLASIGQLAAGVAHEINNPIGYVSSNLNSLADYIRTLLNINAAYGAIESRVALSLPDAFESIRRIKEHRDHEFVVADIRNLLEESREGLERVRKIVRDLKDFSRAGETGWQRVDVHHGLESTLNIVWNEIKYKADVEKQYGDLPEILCMPSQLNQVFLNLLTNAAQAIEERGRIVLRSGRAEGDVWIEVEDNGCGIPPENLERIFEPFYTTKPVGKGTGLGLSLSWGIVQRHHGKIDVRSEPGRGTIFRVILPIDQACGTDTPVETAS